MKYVKIIIKIPLILISILILTLIIDYIRLNLFYIINKNKYAPQGLTYSEKYNVILQTSYNKNNTSMLYIIDFEKDLIAIPLTLDDG